MPGSSTKSYFDASRDALRFAAYKLTRISFDTCELRDDNRRLPTAKTGGQRAIYRGISGRHHHAAIFRFDSFTQRAKRFAVDRISPAYG